MLAASSSCTWNRLYFQPADDTKSEWREGWLPVMSLPLVDDDGGIQGTLYLGSQGIYALALSPGERSRHVLHIEILIANDGDVPLRLESQSQHVAVSASQTTLVPIQLRVNGEISEALVVEPGTSKDADLLFVLEEKQDVARIKGFELSWWIMSPHASFKGQNPFISIAPSDLAYPRESYTGIWKGYFFPGYVKIPEWGRELFFAPFEKPEAMKQP